MIYRYFESSFSKSDHGRNLNGLFAYISFFHGGQNLVRETDLEFRIIIFASKEGGGTDYSFYFKKIYISTVINTSHHFWLKKC